MKTSMKAIALAIALLCGSAQAGMYGSRASFLLKGFGQPWMTLSYLSDDVSEEWRTAMEGTLLNLGDTHIYLYSRNEDPRVGYVTPRDNWEGRLEYLNSIGLRPVMWLMADDSPSLAKLSLPEHAEHNKMIVQKYDSLIDHYVIGLEVDEYWTPDQVNALIENIKLHTDKPIGVHLTPATPLQYAANADVIYFQTGFGLTPEQFREKVRAILSATSQPVIVSEYHLDSTSAEAKHLGDIACALGAIGTGNGRTKTLCGQSKSPVPQAEGSTAIAIGILAIAIGATVYMQNNYTSVRTSNDEGLGARYDTDGTVFLTYKLRW